jgi:tRNA-Thr(GGU) m(6)t(6)A37 methyltransferase TsaA
MSSIVFTSIGIIHSPFKELKGMPIQPAAALDVEGWIEIYPDYVEGLKDLDGFSHIYLLYHFHKANQAKLTVTPFLDTVPRGVFSTRAPSRPNPVGLSVVALDRVDHNRIYIRNVDILDGTPLIDVKPYIPEFEQQEELRTGWLEASGEEIRNKLSDDRFQEKRND